MARTCDGGWLKQANLVIVMQRADGQACTLGELANPHGFRRGRHNGILRLPGRVDNTLTGLVIRRATTRDAALLARFGADEFTAAFGERNDPDDLRAYLASAFSTRIQAAELADADRATWFAETPAADPAGYAMLKRNSQNLLIPEVAPAEVQRFYVSQPFHGRGLAHELMSVCIEQARAWDSDVIWL